MEQQKIDRRKRENRFLEEEPPQKETPLALTNGASQTENTTENLPENGSKVNQFSDVADAEIVVKPKKRISEGIKELAPMDDIGHSVSDHEAEEDTDDFPKMHADGYDNLVGKIVQAISPETESSPEAILLQLLAGLGGCLGRGVFAVVEDSLHPPILFVAIVGDSSVSRKGTGLNRVEAVLVEVDRPFVEACFVSGLTSGQGLAWHIRDGDPEPQNEDERGVLDKRLFVREGELSGAFRQMKGETCTLSATMRDAWDGQTLRSLTTGRQKKPVVASEPHISVVGHMTRADIGFISEADLRNGMANRFLWCASRRSRLLPNGGKPIRELGIDPLLWELRDNIQLAKSFGKIQRTPEANELWIQEYPNLPFETGCPLVDCINQRASAQVLRLSLVFAASEGCREIKLKHLQSALFAWRYYEQSTPWVFKQFGLEGRMPKIVDQVENLLNLRPSREGFLGDLAKATLHSQKILKNLASKYPSRFILEPHKNPKGGPVTGKLRLA